MTAGWRLRRRRPQGSPWRYPEKTVVMAPVNEENPYLPLLRENLAAVGWASVWLKSDLTTSQTLNALTIPVELLAHRLRGASILHMHWAYRFGMPWTKGIPLIRRFPRWWFCATTAFARLVGFTFIYTWHDHLPLVPVFEDDEKAFSFLAGRLDGVITITSAARTQVIERWAVDPERVVVIPEGAPTVIDHVTKVQARQALGLGDAPVIAMFGHVDPYKGFDRMLASLLEVSENIPFAVRMLGRCTDQELLATIEGLLDELATAGRDVVWQNCFFEDGELELLLRSADLSGQPFLWITNSTTMRQSMAYGLTAIVADLPALADVPRDAALFFDHDRRGDLCRVLTQALTEVGSDEAAARGERARQWATSWSWLEVAEATSAFYEQTERRRQGADEPG